jgi:hypothetical protein
VRWPAAPVKAKQPYRFAWRHADGWLDLSRDLDAARLARFELPVFSTPAELADWLEISLARLAWLAGRLNDFDGARSGGTLHYHCRLIRKRSGGLRVIESPKRLLKEVQTRILRGILDKVPCHAAAHGFVRGRSIVTNARPHVARRVVIRLDLENFYPNVGYSRVVAIFRSLGYSREAATWLARLTTSVVPAALLDGAGARDPSMAYEALADQQPVAHGGGARHQLAAYRVRHLPQGAPTSPALANLSAFSLDLRLVGLAGRFEAAYTRYADDLTFSGSQGLLESLSTFLPLTTAIIRSERFRVNVSKRRVSRNSGRQQVTGVVVNARPNVARSDFDRLKAILTNCIRRGPSTQNHEKRGDFAAHLLGRIAHVGHLNPGRGAKLRALFAQINWKR